MSKLHLLILLFLNLVSFLGKRLRDSCLNTCSLSIRKSGERLRGIAVNIESIPENTSDLFANCTSFIFTHPYNLMKQVIISLVNKHDLSVAIKDDEIKQIGREYKNRFGAFLQVPATRAGAIDHHFKSEEMACNRI